MLTDHPKSDDANRDRRDRVADDREAALEKREAAAAAHESDVDARAGEVRTILADAARRDAVADVRDARADVREKEASLNAFVRPAYGDHVASLQARRASATNRVESKSDRSSSADDRTKLTEALSVRAGDDAWVMLLSNHARVLATIAANPSSTLRHLALTVDITERSVFSIIDDLDEGGYLVRHKHGRRNSYELDLGRHVMAGHDGTVGDLIRLFST